MKVKIESCIIGAVISDNSFYKISGILRPSNFSRTLEVDHVAIWTCLQELDKNLQAIDLLTVSCSLKQKFKLDYAYRLTEYTTYVCSSEHLKSWAFMLLELDIRNKALDSVNDYLQRLQSDPVATKELKQILTVMSDTSKDIFQIIEGAIRYTQARASSHYGAGLMDFTNDLKALSCQIDEKIIHLKKLDNYKRLQGILKRMEEDLGIVASQKNPN